VHYDVMPQSCRATSAHARPVPLFLLVFLFLHSKSLVVKVRATHRIESTVNQRIPTSELIGTGTSHRIASPRIINDCLGPLFVHSSIPVSFRVHSSHTTWEGAAVPSSYLQVSCVYRLCFFLLLRTHLNAPWTQDPMKHHAVQADQ